METTPNSFMLETVFLSVILMNDCLIITFNFFFYLDCKAP